MPMTASSCCGTSERSPCPAIRSPPMPAKRTAPPVRSWSAAISAPPSTSPEGSPAMMKISGASVSAAMPAGSARLDADDEEIRRVGGGDDTRGVEDDRRAGLDGDAAQPGGERRLDSAHADRRQIGAPLLLRLGHLDEGAARALAAQLPAACPQRAGPPRPPRPRPEPPPGRD